MLRGSRYLVGRSFNHGAFAFGKKNDPIVRASRTPRRRVVAGKLENNHFALKSSEKFKSVVDGL